MKKKKRDTNNIWDKEKTISKRIHLKLTMSIITLTVNVINTSPSKKQTSSERIVTILSN